MTVLNLLFVFPQLLLHLVDRGVDRGQQVLRLAHRHEIVLLGRYLQIDRGLVSVLQVDGESRWH